MIKLITIALIAAIFSGCSLKDVSKPVVKYTIDTDKTTQQETIVSDKILKIVRLKSPKYIQNSNIWYENQSLEMNAYLYSAWSEDFPDLIEQNIADTIFKSGLFKSTFTRYSKINPDLLLEGEIVKSIQKIYVNNSTIELSVRLYLVNHKNSKLIDSKEFTYREECSSVDAKGAVKAYKKIVKNLNKDVVLWLRNLVKEN